MFVVMLGTKIVSKRKHKNYIDAQGEAIRLAETYDQKREKHMPKHPVFDIVEI